MQEYAFETRRSHETNVELNTCKQLWLFDFPYVIHSAANRIPLRYKHPSHKTAFRFISILRDEITVDSVYLF